MEMSPAPFQQAALSLEDLSTSEVCYPCTARHNHQVNITTDFGACWADFSRAKCSTRDWSRTITQPVAPSSSWCPSFTARPRTDPALLLEVGIQPVS